VRRCAATSAALLVALTIVAAVTDFDTFVSDRLFAAGRAWPIDHAHGALRMALYDGPKIVIGLIGLYFLAASLRPGLLGALPVSPQQARFVFVCILTVPVVVASIKYHSNVVCAGELQRYGGQWPDALGHFRPGRLFEPAQFRGCWPSGHVSGGFALLSLAFLGDSRRHRALLWLAGAMVGGLMGAYQVARGAHFLSHVFITALMAQLLVCLIAAWMLPTTRPA